MEIALIDKEQERARYHSSAMDSGYLDKNENFDKLTETYVIFITENDYFKENKPLYVIERINTTTGKPFGDGEHILYATAQYKGDDAFGKLMHDFLCILPEMAEKTRYYKENEKGVESMCKAMEDRIKITEKERLYSLLSECYSLERTSCLILQI